jgi:transcriptional regulator with GAF, ATPase, and Fis domain
MAAAGAQIYLPVRNRVLIASADPLFRLRVMKKAVFADCDYEQAVGGAHALAKLKQITCTNVLLDRYLPDLDSEELATLIQKRYPGVIVGFLDSKTVDEIELCEKHVSATPRSATAQEDRGSANERCFTYAAVTAPAPEEPLEGMIGSSPVMQQVYRLARMVARRDTTVLITGETGTGKELVAEAIHKMSPRSRHPFVVVNCAAIPEALFESELFGHARGAFTGAIQSRLGRAHMAQGGTLFLDEIGELPLSMQAKLLRFLQNGEVQRLGSSDVYRVDVRVICATNVRLADLVNTKHFREDLFYRMAVFPIAMPPLRDHPEDVGALADHFLTKLCSDISIPKKWLTNAAHDFLLQARWAGNVRELQHVLERVFILSGNESEIVPATFKIGMGNIGMSNLIES